MFAVPAATPVTTPDEFTVATDVASEDHEAPVEFVVVAVKVCESPEHRAKLDALIVGAATTLTVVLAE
jgi:hypothetical protein